MQNILVTGGAGYIGSHVVRALSDRYNVIVIDNLTEGHREAVAVPLVHADISDSLALSKIFETYQIDAVMHFSAFINVGESVQNPEKYYCNNVAATLTLLSCMLKYNVKNFIFSSTCAIYGNPQYSPLDEKHPYKPINTYGSSKLMIEKILEDYANSYDFNYAALRYFNAAGAAPDGTLGESHKVETHLIPLILKTLTGERENIQIFGTDYDTPDGTCIRDYIHVCDLASAHCLALEKLLSGSGSFCVNLGTGIGSSVREVINACEEVSGRKVPVVYGERRAGDPAVLVAANDYMKSFLGFTPQYMDIRDIISTAWNWEQKRKF